MSEKTGTKRIGWDEELQRLEREQDEATLAFWESIMEVDKLRSDLRLAEARYDFSNKRMMQAKSTYLKAKLGRKP